MKKFLCLILTIFSFSVYSQEMKSDIMERECNEKLKQINQEIDKINQSKTFRLSQVQQGLICSVCKRSKNEIEKYDNFEAHLESVDGVATASDLQEARNKIIENHRKDYERLSGNYDKRVETCNRDIEEQRKREEEELQRLLEEEERKEEEERISQEEKIEEEETRIQDEEKRKEEKRKQEEEKRLLEEREIERLEKEMERLEKERQARELERLQTELTNQLNDMTNQSKNSADQKISQIRSSRNKFKNSSLGSGLSDRDISHSVDVRKTNASFSDFSYDDDSFDDIEFVEPSHNKFSKSTIVDDNSYNESNIEWGKYYQDIKTEVVRNLQGKLKKFVVVETKKEIKNLIKMYSYNKNYESTIEYGKSFSKFVDSQGDDTNKLFDQFITTNKNYNVDQYWDRTQKRTKNYILEISGCGKIPFCSTINKYIDNNF